MPGRGSEQVPERTQHMWTNSVALVGEDVWRCVLVGDCDVEMIEPELRQDFLKLMLGINGPQDALSKQLHSEIGPIGQPVVVLVSEDFFFGRVSGRYELPHAWSSQL